MEGKRLLGAILAAGLGLVAMTAASDAQADGKGKKEAPAAAVAADPPMTKKPIVPRRDFDDAFKREALRILANSGRTIEEVAEDLGPTSPR